MLKQQEIRENSVCRRVNSQTILSLKGKRKNFLACLQGLYFIIFNIKPF